MPRGELLAFRAGNFGADERTWEAMARAGLVASAATSTPVTSSETARFGGRGNPGPLRSRKTASCELPIYQLQRRQRRLPPPANHGRFAGRNERLPDAGACARHPRGHLLHALVRVLLHRRSAASGTPRRRRSTSRGCAACRTFCAPTPASSRSRPSVSWRGAARRRRRRRASCPGQAAAQARPHARAAAQARRIGFQSGEPLLRMMTGANIICFAKDWSEDPTRNNHVMKLLARDNEVLWLNSIATRTPKLSSSSDMGKIKRKLKSFVDGPQRVDEHARLVGVTRRSCCRSRTSARRCAMNRQILRGTHRLFPPPPRHGRLPAVELHPDGGRSTSATLGESLRRLLLHRRVVAVQLRRRRASHRAWSASSADAATSSSRRRARCSTARSSGTRRRTSRRTASISTTSRVRSRPRPTIARRARRLEASRPRLLRPGAGLDRHRSRSAGSPSSGPTGPS